MTPDDADSGQSLAYQAGGVVFWIVVIGVVVALIVKAYKRHNARVQTAAWGPPVIMAGPQWRFNPPPGWPPLPPGFVPPPGWQPDPSWPAAPPHWQWWTATP